jgi:ubiquitin C-terminal hydrolase
MHGFTNIGNTCYFNSAIQCFLHIHNISSHIVRNKYKGDCLFTKIYEHVVHVYFSTHEVKVFTLEPLLNEFVKIFPRFKIGEPHDAQDALLCIIDILEKEYPIIKDLLYGETTQVTISPVSKNIIKTPFCIHILNMKNETKNIDEMIEEGYNWNIIEGYVDNDNVKHHVATTRCFISKKPKILLVSFDKKSNVKVDTSLKMGYDLRGSIIHKGIQWGGHYMSMAKFGEEWIIQDDDSLGKLNELPKEDSHYILVYSLKTPSSECLP